MRERPQPLLSDGGECDAHDALVVTVLHPSDESGPLCSVDEFHRAVVSEQEMGGEVTHTGHRTMTSDGQEQLMLGRSHTRVVCPLLAPVQEPTQTVPEGEEPLVVVVRQLLWT